MDANRIGLYLFSCHCIFFLVPSKFCNSSNTHFSKRTKSEQFHKKKSSSIRIIKDLFFKKKSFSSSLYIYISCLSLLSNGYIKFWNKIRKNFWNYYISLFSSIKDCCQTTLIEVGFEFFSLAWIQNEKSIIKHILIKEYYQTHPNWSWVWKRYDQPISFFFIIII
jgi:hypothetical protein